VEDMCYEIGPVRNSVLQHRVAPCFSLVPLVWELNPKLQGGWCKPNHQPIGGSDPNHQGIWSPPRAGPGTYHMCICVCVYYCSTYYKAVRVGGGGEQWRTCATRDYEPRPVWTRLPITH
jgi:hypothetical protein